MAQRVPGYKGFMAVGLQTGSDLRAAKVSRTHWCRFLNHEIQENQNYERDPSSGRGEAEAGTGGDYDVQVKGELEGTTEGAIPMLAQSLTGTTIATSTVGTTGKQQRITGIADQLGSKSRLTLEERQGANAESKLVNMVVKELGFKLDDAGWASWDYAAVGSSPEYLGTPSTPTLPAMTTRLSQRVTTFTFDSLTTHVMRNGTWKLKRILDEDDYDTTSRQRRDAGYKDDFMVELDLELAFFDMAQQKRFWGGASATAPVDPETYYPVNIKTERADVIPGGTAKHGVTLDLPRMLMTARSPALQARDIVRQRVTLQGFYDSGSSYQARLDFTNTVASYG